MFSRNGQYVINQFQEDSFNRQLPSISTKIPYKKKRQKILNVNQTKFQLDLIREKIYQKCKNDELQYLQQLDLERKRFLKLKEEKMKSQNLKDILKNKYQAVKKENSTNKSLLPKDSVDLLKQNKSKSVHQPKIKLEFALEQNQQKKIQQVAENQWINKVRYARKKLQNKFGRYYEPLPFKNNSDDDDQSQELSQRKNKSSRYKQE